jgi:deoxyribodipyrimidine photo-lyase
VKTYAGFRRAWQPVRDGDRHEAIDAFVETLLALYADDRDFPAREGTSRLSPLIASGEITVADCAAAALEAPPSKGREKWLDELCWHEWFEHVKSSGLDAPRREPMHNRARMVTASFLVKHLHLDWRTGEAWFAEKLVDYDPAQNAGNWQWVAGTGIDAQPWFRILNPERQRERFDPEDAYCRRWLPDWETDDYPEPMLDLAAEAAEAKERFRAASR